MTSEPTTIHVDQLLAHSPARVWRALTDPEVLAKWLMPNDFRPIVGHRFTFRTQPQPGFDGIVHCEVLVCESEERLQWAWRNGLLDTTVTWTLRAEGHGTRLFLVHDGFDPNDPLQRRTYAILDGGWRSHVFAAIARELNDL